MVVIKVNVLACIVLLAVFWQSFPLRVQLNRKHQTQTKLNLFNGLFGKSKNGGGEPKVVQPAAGKAADSQKIEKLKANLEKVSKTQNRDYEAEAKARAPKAPQIKDKQVLSFNFNKPNEFPNLFKGWIKADGGQIEKQMIASTKAALSKEKYIEVLFDPVPNLDEVAFGTVWNKKLRMEVAADLQVPDYATNRGGPATLEWSNVYWANRLAVGLSSQKKIVALSISGEGTKGQYLPKLAKNLQLTTLSAAKTTLKPGDATLLVVLSPCQESHYKDAKNLADKLNVPVVALNAPYSYIYDIGGGKPFELAYVMKRIPKGWIFRQYPKPFEAIIEGPNYDGTYPTKPSLVEISKLSMAASAEKYGAAGNDRIFQQRL